MADLAAIGSEIGFERDAQLVNAEVWELECLEGLCGGRWNPLLDPLFTRQEIDGLMRECRSTFKFRGQRRFLSTYDTEKNQAYLDSKLR